LRGAFFRTFLCANSLISRTVLRRPFPSPHPAAPENPTMHLPHTQAR
jgi:hypothetical protein